VLETSIAFYKRVLCAHDLTIHDCSSRQAQSCVWREVTANRAAN
jgi:hypothetical protein